MQEIKLEKKDYKFVFSPYEQPVATVTPGEDVVLYTEDAYSGNLTREDLDPKKVVKYSNPQVGPIYIEGAKAGDTLKVDIISISPARDWAVSCINREFGALQSTRKVRLLNEPLPLKVFIYRYRDGMFTYNNSRLSFPFEPFLGTIATAPDIQAVSSNVPFEQGGNMDVPDVKPGNSVYLPIEKDGAYFYTGDCHAKQGQGETCGTALEIAAKVTLRFSLLKGYTIRHPRIESPDELMCVGSARPMEDAARIACYELVQWLVELGWDVYEAYQAVTMDSCLYVGNMVDPNYSMVAKIKKELAYRK